MRTGRTGLLTAVAGLLVLVAGCSGHAAEPAPQPHLLPGPQYYLALGDSLSQGVQPDSDGASLPTRAGYPNRIYSVLHAQDRNWRLVKLGCSGETTHTMIHGGICHYAAGSQLLQAAAFLRAHRGHLGLVTIDIGANDPNSCFYGGASVSKILPCMGNSISRSAADLRLIMADLRAAAGPDVTILAMSYYVPELAGWMDGTVGEEVAVLTERLVAGYNQMLGKIYRAYGARVANVFGAFNSSDFGSKIRLADYGVLPRNVATICQWTWACAHSPRGPNEHANAAGYEVIARAFLRADPQLAR